VKKLILLKWVLSLLIASFYSGIWIGSIPASQEKPTITKSPPAEKKQPSKASDENLPEIFIEIPEYDAGEVYEGTLVTHSFIVKNRGKRKLLIKKVRPG